jgi:hypothetical protein
MGANDGKVEKTTKIVNKGPDNECFNIVLIAEGFKASELKKFEGYCDDFIKHFNKTSPFKDCAAKINFHRINISSKESGAADPKTCGKDTSGTGTTVKTYLDARYCDDGKIRRLMGFNKSLAQQVLKNNVKAWHRALIIVNTTQYGGAGGEIAIVSVHGDWTSTALHELGHTFKLADEYQDYYGCPPPPHPSQNYHSAVEPAEPNVTTKKKRHEIKWRHLILPQTPIPTLSNPNCQLCNTLPNPRPAGTVGLYEGAHYCHCGAFRPSYDCMMRNYADFCAVCQGEIRKKIAPFIKTSDLAITPWGYSQIPPKQPYWQTPDIWGNPVRGQSKNDLHIRVHNVGKVKSLPFKVRVSYVPFTTMIDLKNEVMIGVFSRPALANGASDHFVVNWDLTPPKLPQKFAAYKHFCVIAQIQVDECNTTNNKAQNNFCNVPVKKGGSPPPPVRFEVANPWEEETLAQLVLSSDDRRLVLEAIDFDPDEFPLEPGERRVVEVALRLTDGVIDQPGRMEANFEITQLLNGQVVGGVSGVVTQTTGIRVVLGGSNFDYQAVREALLHTVPWQEITRQIFPDEDVPVVVDLLREGPLAEDAREAEYNPARAKELLAEAGFGRGFHLYVLFSFEDEAVAQVVELVAEALGEIHVGTSLCTTVPVDALAKMEAMTNAGIQVLWIGR